jgi:eukaryotic-like serine/threonine-protein kinase
VSNAHSEYLLAEPELPLSSPLADALRDRYTLEREIGRGGMATVYLAHDLKHDRVVALKVLHAELAHSLGPDRFLREIRTAARLQHPHILSVYDSGTAGQRDSGAGWLWFTMPYVEGESLRGRLERERQLPLDDAVHIAAEAARALDYAHRQGVIHRDVKPENILLTRDGDTLVADFGIARALGGEAGKRGGGEEDRLTETGFSLGTPAYMSPEQATGERELDGRTDVYSLGVVLYEMLAGEPPYTGPTAQAILARSLTEKPRPLRLSRETVPEAVESAVQKALAKTPADRFATIGEFGRALSATSATTLPGTPPGTSVPNVAPKFAGRPTLAAAILAFLLGVGVLFAWRHSHPEAAAAAERTIAVLPFENLGRPDDEYFADGMTDAVRGKLAAVPGLQVIASSSSGEYKKSSKSLSQIAHELGANYLLTARVRWAKEAGGASEVEVSPELIQVARGRAPTTKWGQPFSAALTDVFEVQGKIASEVAEKLDVALGQGEQQQLAERPTQNLAAYDAFLKGEEATKGVANADPPTLRRAIGQYEQAVALDPNFAQAWAALGRAQAVMYINGIPTPEGAAAAKTAAERALALAPTLPEGYLALGSYEIAVLKDYSRALQEYSAGQRLAPKNAEMLAAIAYTEQVLGRWPEAVQHFREALQLDPRSVGTARRLARALLWLRRYPETLRECNYTLAIAPGNLDVLETKVMVYLAQGDLAGARAVLRAVPKEVEPTALLAYLANVWDLVWVPDEDQQQLLLRLTPSAFDGDRGAWGLVLAQIYALRSETAQVRAYADSAQIALEGQLKSTPGDPQRRVFLGMTLAYLGRKADALREAERGAALLPPQRDAFVGTYLQHQLARVYLLAGEPDKALDLLEQLLRRPYYLSPGWLRIDPTFKPLHGNPRFEKLAGY